MNIKDIPIELHIWNLFKVNNTDTRTTQMTSFWCLCFYLCTDISYGWYFHEWLWTGKCWVGNCFMYVGKCKIVQVVNLEKNNKWKMLYTVIYACYVITCNFQLQNVTLTNFKFVTFNLKVKSQRLFDWLSFLNRNLQRAAKKISDNAICNT